MKYTLFAAAAITTFTQAVSLASDTSDITINIGEAAVSSPDLQATGGSPTPTPPPVPTPRSSYWTEHDFCESYGGRDGYDQELYRIITKDYMLTNLVLDHSENLYEDGPAYRAGTATPVGKFQCGEF